jgi:hypothetical protein
VANDGTQQSSYTCRHQLASTARGCLVTRAAIWCLAVLAFAAPVKLQAQGADDARADALTGAVPGCSIEEIEQKLVDASKRLETGGRNAVVAFQETLKIYSAEKSAMSLLEEAADKLALAQHLAGQSKAEGARGELNQALQLLGEAHTKTRCGPLRLLISKEVEEVEEMLQAALAEGTIQSYPSGTVPSVESNVPDYDGLGALEPSYPSGAVPSAESDVPDYDGLGTLD